MVDPPSSSHAIPNKRRIRGGSETTALQITHSKPGIFGSHVRHSVWEDPEAPEITALIPILGGGGGGWLEVLVSPA